MKNKTYFHLFGFKSLAVTRFRILLLLILLLTASTSIGFAIWDNTNNTLDDNPIIIGEGANLEVVRTLSAPDDGKVLIPKGSFKGQEDVYYYQYNFDIVFNKEGQLIIDVIDVDELGEIFELFEFYVSFDKENYDTATNVLIIDLTKESTYYNESFDTFALTVYITVTMKVPSSAELVALIQNNTFNFGARFRALEFEG